MTMTKRLIRWLAPGLLLLLALSCGAQQPAAPFQPPEATSPPDISATVTARDRALPQGGPLPTAVPPQAIQAAQDFAAAQDALSTDWDQVHRDLAGWRLGLTSCHESSVSVALIAEVSLRSTTAGRGPAVCAGRTRAGRWGANPPSPSSQARGFLRPHELFL